MPDEPLALPVGTVDDYVAVEGSNSIRRPDGGRYQSWKRIIYAAGVGIVKVESDNAKLERTLIEFSPPLERNVPRTGSDPGR